MSRHDEMTAYLAPHITEIFGCVAGFNCSLDTPGTVGFATEYEERIIKKYVRAAKKAYGFAVLITQDYSQGTDDVNLTAMNLAQAFGDWITAQDKAKNYPVFSGAQVLEIKFLQNMPNVAEINEEGTVAKYMLSCRTIYYEED